MRRLLLSLSLVVPAAMSAQQQPATPPQRPPTCTTPTHAAFDYWVGEWIVADTTGRDIAESSITKLADGCAVLEQWRPRGGPQGTSLNWVETTDGKWHQRWISGASPSVLFVGGATDGIMQLTTQGGPATKQWARMTWLKRPNGVVRQIFENSTDGTTWTASFVGDYRPKR
ncbi:MAG TPA: hypothetical protein PLJ23_00220 [Gemmatimonadales bacterium]|jgi:hypothetical protein|nr:hypothetical protein [Gemmatimonadales bacterium]